MNFSECCHCSVNISTTNESIQPAATERPCSRNTSKPLSVGGRFSWIRSLDHLETTAQVPPARVARCHADSGIFVRSPRDKKRRERTGQGRWTALRECFGFDRVTNSLVRWTRGSRPHRHWMAANLCRSNSQRGFVHPMWKLWVPVWGVEDAWEPKTY